MFLSACEPCSCSQSGTACFGWHMNMQVCIARRHCVQHGVHSATRLTLPTSGVEGGDGVDGAWGGDGAACLALSAACTM